MEKISQVKFNQIYLIKQTLECKEKSPKISNYYFDEEKERFLPCKKGCTECGYDSHLCNKCDKFNGYWINEIADKNLLEKIEKLGLTKEDYFNCVTECPLMKMHSDGKCNFFLKIGIKHNLLPSNFTFSSDDKNKTEEQDERKQKERIGYFFFPYKRRKRSESFEDFY